MTWLAVLAARVRGLFQSRQAEERLAEEVEAHLSHLASEYERQGMHPAEARQRARREFGGVTQMREDHREQRGLPLVDTLAQDLKFGWRQLRKSPAFTAAAVATLALGIGANTAIYRVLDAVVLRSLAVPEPGRLVIVQLLQSGDPIHFSYPLFREMARNQQVLQGMFATSEFPLNQAAVEDRGPLRAVKGELVSAGYFDILGVHPRAGRLFREEDERADAAPAAVLGYDFWSREFGRNPSVVGQTLRVNGIVAAIVGVTPPGFYGDTVGTAPDIWLPMSVQPRVMATDWINAPSSSWLQVMGRLRDGVPARQAQTALDALYQQLSSLGVRSVGHTYSLRLDPGGHGLAGIQERFGGPLWLLASLVSLVLLMACCNLASLLLGRATARTHEMGIRLAIGASRRRLIRHLLTESLLLAVSGAAAGSVLAWWGSRALVSVASAGRNWQLPLDSGVKLFAFTGAITLLATCLFGIAPALAATRVEWNAALQGGRRGQTAGRGRRWFGRSLVVAQIAISILLVSGSWLLVRSLWNLRHQDYGFRSEGILNVDLPLQFRRDIMARAKALRQPLYERLNALPGVHSAAVSGFGPFGSMQHTGSYSSAHRAADRSDFGRLVHVSPRYFETMGIPIVTGRAITEEDREGAPGVAVISETAARLLFPGEDPIGQAFSGGQKFDSAKGLRVIGVARDVRFSSPKDPYRFVVYVPFAQDPVPVTGAVLRAPASMTNAVRATIASVDSSVKIGAIESVEVSIESRLSDERLLALLGSAFGILALILTSVGVYGVVSYAVERRTQEIGIRLALGASRLRVTGSMIGEIGGLLAVSVALGVAGTMFLTGRAQDLLFGIGPRDWAAFAPGAALLALVAIAAAWIPARRAARLDPMDALRQE